MTDSLTDLMNAFEEERNCSLLSGGILNLLELVKIYHEWKCFVL